MSYSTTVDISGLVDGSVNSSASVKTPVANLKSELENLGNGVSLPEQLRLKQIATPSNPAAGGDKLYFKSDDILYRLTSAGTETAVGPYTLPNQPIRATMFHDEATALAGNAIAITVSTTQPYNYYAAQSTAAQNDAFTQSFYLAAGTYTFSVLGVTAVNCAQVDWYLDGTRFVTAQDWYSGSSVFNVIKTTSSVTVATTGRHQLKGIAATRNGSNTTGWFLDLTKYWFNQSAD